MLLWLLPTTFGCSTPAAKLVLEEVRAVEVPPNFSVTGVSASADGSILIWSSGNSHLLLLGEKGFTKIGRELQAPIAAAFVGGEHVEVVDAAQNAIVRFHGLETVSRRPVALRTSIEAAARSGSEWIMATKDSTDAYVVVRAGEDGQTYPILKLSHSGNPSFDRQFHITSDGVRGNATLTAAAFPYTVISLNAFGLASEIHKNPRIPDDRSVLPLPLWASLPTLALDSGYVQTLADLRSDKRILLLYDTRGRLLRQSTIDVPQAFAAAVPGRRLLIAVRNWGRQEIVVYRWSWGERTRWNKQPS